MASARSAESSAQSHLPQPAPVASGLRLVLRRVHGKTVAHRELDAVKSLGRGPVDELARLLLAAESAVDPSVKRDVVVHSWKTVEKTGQTCILIFTLFSSAKTSFIVSATESSVWYLSGFTPLATQLTK